MWKGSTDLVETKIIAYYVHLERAFATFVIDSQ